MRGKNKILFSCFRQHTGVFLNVFIFYVYNLNLRAPSFLHVMLFFLLMESSSVNRNVYGFYK